MNGDPYCAIHGFNPCRCHEFPAVGPFTTPKMTHEQTCPHCGLLHSTTCPRIKAIEYYENGLTKRIEFHSERTSE